MKTKLLLLVTSMLVGASAAIAVDRVETAQLPSAVKKTLDASTLGEPVKEITVRKMQDRTVYEVELERNNTPNPHLRIAEDGQLISDTRKVSSTEVAPNYIYPDGMTGVATTPRFRLEELPDPARQTIQREAAGREIGLITEGSIDGRKAYAVEFRERGRNPRFYVARDGTVLRPLEKPPALGFGTMISDTPAAVQQTIRREIGDGEIQRIDKENHRGEPDTYKVSVKDAHGTFQLSLSADGRVLGNTRGTQRLPNRG